MRNARGSVFGVKNGRNNTFLNKLASIQQKDCDRMTTKGETRKATRLLTKNFNANPLKHYSLLQQQFVWSLFKSSIHKALYLIEVLLHCASSFG